MPIYSFNTNNQRNNNPKLRIILIVVLIVVLVLIIFLFTKFRLDDTKSGSGYQKLLSDYPEIARCDKLKKAEKNPINERCDNKKCDYNKEDSWACYLKIINTRLDERLCEKIRKDIPGALGYRDYCFNEIAVNKGDVTICDKIQSPVSRDSCRNRIAVDTNNETFCSSDYCYQKIAKAKEDERICKNIKKQQDQIDCFIDIAVVKRDENICVVYLWEMESKSPIIYSSDHVKMLPASDICYLKLATLETTKVKSQEMCGKIQDSYVSDKCFLESNPCYFLTDSGQDWLTYKNNSFGFEFQYPASWIEPRNEYPDIMSYGYEIFRNFLYFRTPYKIDDAELGPPDSYDDIDKKCGAEEDNLICEKQENLIINSVPVKKYFQLSKEDNSKFKFPEDDYPVFTKYLMKKYIAKTAIKIPKDYPEEDLPSRIMWWQGDINIGLNFKHLYPLYFRGGEAGERNGSWIHMPFGVEWTDVASRVESITIGTDENAGDFQKKLISKIENRTADKCILDTVDMFDKMMSTFKYIK